MSTRIARLPSHNVPLASRQHEMEARARRDRAVHRARPRRQRGAEPLSPDRHRQRHRRAAGCLDRAGRSRPRRQARHESRGPRTIGAGASPRHARSTRAVSRAFRGPAGDVPVLRRPGPGGCERFGDGRSSRASRARRPQRRRTRLLPAGTRDPEAVHLEAVGGACRQPAHRLHVDSRFRRERQRRSGPDRDDPPAARELPR